MSELYCATIFIVILVTFGYLIEWWVEVRNDKRSTK